MIARAALDEALLTLHNAADHIVRTGHMNCPWPFTRNDVMAIQEAVGILKAAAKEIVCGEVSQ